MAANPITRLQREHLPQLQALLRNEQLPFEDCADSWVIFYGIVDRSVLIAAAGLEPASNDSLLRSVVVHPAHRGRGLARDLIKHLIHEAEAENSRGIYLLTTSAVGYFEALGFAMLVRDQVPAAIAATKQFTSLCPDSASCLMMRLTQQGASRALLK